MVQKNLKFYQRRDNFVILKLSCKLGTYILINLNWLNKFTTGTGTGTYCLCWGIIFLKRCPKFGIFYHKGLTKFSKKFASYVCRRFSDFYFKTLLRIKNVLKARFFVCLLVISVAISSIMDSWSLVDKCRLHTVKNVFWILPAYTKLLLGLLKLENLK